MFSLISGEILKREEKRIREFEQRISRLRQKYGMDFDEFFEMVESFSGLKRLMEKFDLGKILEDSFIWEFQLLWNTVRVVSNSIAIGGLL